MNIIWLLFGIRVVENFNDMFSSWSVIVIIPKLTSIGLMMIINWSYWWSIWYFPSLRLTVISACQYFLTVVSEINIIYNVVVICVYWSNKTKSTPIQNIYIVFLSCHCYVLLIFRKHCFPYFHPKVIHF